MRAVYLLGVPLVWCFFGSTDRLCAFLAHLLVSK
jgi:hypothetical protein